jgi:hypothetical protein
MMAYCGTSQKTLMGTAARLFSKPSAWTCAARPQRVTRVGRASPRGALARSWSPAIQDRARVGNIQIGRLEQLSHAVLLAFCAWT